MRLGPHVAGSGRESCNCAHDGEAPPLLVVTGGPGAGKTALLNLARQRFCSHVYVLEESASIVFGGGFPRYDSDGARRAAQRAIYHVQIELERLAREHSAASVVLCDRGTVDGAAYWPGAAEQFFREVGSSLTREVSHYAAVLHLRTPPPAHYTHSNTLRIETAEEARQIDERIMDVWASHPNRFVVNSDEDFLSKARRALDWLETQIPACCRASASGSDRPQAISA